MLLVSAFTIAGCSDNRWSVPENYRDVKNPFERNDANITSGRELYDRHCSTCHGKTGMGDGLKSAALTQSPGDFSKRKYQKQKDGEQFYKTRTGRGEMPGYGGIITDDDIWRIVCYMRTFAP